MHSVFYSGLDWVHHTVPQYLSKKKKNSYSLFKSLLITGFPSIYTIFNQKKSSVYLTGITCVHSILTSSKVPHIVHSKCILSYIEKHIILKWLYLLIYLHTAKQKKQVKVTFAKFSNTPCDLFFLFKKKFYTLTKVDFN